MEGPSEIDFAVRDELRDQCKRNKIKVKKLNIILDTIVFATKNNSVRARECVQITGRFIGLCNSNRLRGGDAFVLNYWKYTLMMERLGGSIGKQYDLLGVLRSFIITCHDQRRVQPWGLNGICPHMHLMKGADNFCGGAENFWSVS